MISISFPDGRIAQFPAGITPTEIANGISKSLAKKTIAAKFNGNLLDLYIPLTTDGKLELITSEAPEGVDIIRHDTTHIMAQAVKELFPDTALAIGPTIENGFYYDFATTRPFTMEDLPAIEERMHEIIKRDLPIKRSTMSKTEALAFFTARQETYKVEIIKALADNETISIYTQGDFIDPCRGPHAPSTNYPKAFKLLKIAGAYWRGDSKNAVLQRIYGTAFANEKDLATYLHMLAEAEKRDHRKLGKEMDLFHFQEEAPGAVFWHPKGWNIMQVLINYMRERRTAGGYQEISTPELLDRCFWEQSGHWEKYSHNMFTAQTGDEEKVYAIKPMNCPGCVQVFKHSLRSYRELPMRISEFGKVHRYEPSGALHGLMRVRAFTQDDAHIFITEEQLMEECRSICQSTLAIYKDFGFENVLIKFSDRPEKRIGSDAVWDKAEASLIKAVEAAGLEYVANPGEGAFYGPKLEFTLHDTIGRAWQVGTLQVDLTLPERLGATYIGEDGNRHTPVMLHLATFGSLERFLGILLEHHAGKLPLWLAPIQVVVASITNAVDDYCDQVHQKLQAVGIRVLLDKENEKIDYKIRKHSLSKTPIIVSLGKKEAEAQQVSVRKLGEEGFSVVSLDEFIKNLSSDALPPHKYLK